MADSTSGWVVTGSLATAATAVFAGWQMWLARRDSKNRAAFEFLRDIDNRVQATWSSRTTVVQSEILAYYRKERSDLTPGGRCYFALLNSLELLAYAIKKGLVDRKTVDDFVKTLVSSDVLSLTFLHDLQACCKSPGVYEHLYEYFLKLWPHNGHRQLTKEG